MRHRRLAGLRRLREEGLTLGDYIWELRNPDGGMLGLEFARGVSAPTDVMLAHSLPERVDVTVRSGEELVASGDALTADEDSPMARLRIEGSRVVRDAVWPTDGDLDTPVILPGGEVGILKSWWNADDHSEWRWQVEFHNAT